MDKSNSSKLIGTIFFDSTECVYYLQLPSGIKLVVSSLDYLDDALELAVLVSHGNIAILSGSKN